MRYFCRCLQGVPPHSKGQHVQRHFEKQVGSWHLSYFETKGLDADLIYAGKSVTLAKSNKSCSIKLVLDYIPLELSFRSLGDHCNNIPNILSAHFCVYCLCTFFCH